MDRSDLANRMKDYEKRNRYYLQKRMPVIIRLDMRAGHTFTRGFQRPFDEIFMKSMQETAKYLCENVQNTKLAYVQSDEITLVLIDYEDINTDAFFDYRVDKLCSIAASMATMAFNKAFERNIDAFFCNEVVDNCMNISSETKYQLHNTYIKASNKGAMFDARCFNIPKEEVTNLVYWRQLDATRNSVQMVGRAYFSHKELDHKSRTDIKNMLLEKGVDWESYPTYLKRGSCCIKMYQLDEGSCQSLAEDKLMPYGRTKWAVDKEIPIFKGDGREYIERLINFDDNCDIKSVFIN